MGCLGPSIVLKASNITITVPFCTYHTQGIIIYFFNPLTPVPAVTARDEPWPFFHF